MWTKIFSVAWTGQSGILHVICVFVCDATAHVRPPQTVTVAPVSPKPFPVSVSVAFAARAVADEVISVAVREERAVKLQLVAGAGMR
jgi:hypothetical protein